MIDAYWKGAVLYDVFSGKFALNDDSLALKPVGIKGLIGDNLN
jgi:hypothetical protein